MEDLVSLNKKQTGVKRRGQQLPQSLNGSLRHNSMINLKNKINKRHYYFLANLKKEKKTTTACLLYDS